MELYPIVTDSHELEYSPAMFALRTGFLASVKPGTTLKETLVRKRVSKTNQQVKTIWGLLVATIKSAFDDRGWDMGTVFPGLDIPPGEPMDRDAIMLILYAACGKKKTLSKMDIAEASEFFERCRRYAAKKWQIQVPDPDPNWRETQRKLAEARR